MNDELRLSDNDRINALQALAGHYAEGRLDHAEFDERTEAVTQSRTNGDLRPLFTDLPGGLQEALTPTRTSGVVDTQVDAELERVRTVGKKIETYDGVVFSVTLASFFILMFVFSISWAWVVWPVMAAVMAIPRVIGSFSDSDEKTYQELKKAEEAERAERLRQATARLRELE